jgi:hypothetical protein
MLANCVMEEILVKGPPLVEAVLGGATPTGGASWPKIRPQNSTEAEKNVSTGRNCVSFVSLISLLKNCWKFI